MEEYLLGKDNYWNFRFSLRNRQPDPNRIVPPELEMHLKYLDSANNRMPESKESSTARDVITKEQVKDPELIPNYYPSKPMGHMNEMQYFMDLDASTLFFIGCCFDGTRAQYLAAKALKAQSWIFNEKSRTWYKCVENLRKLRESCEIGCYYYFDCKNFMISKWDNS